MAACPPPIRRQVSDHVGPVKHMTRSHVQPFHNNCESVDLWAAGIILMDMLVIGTIGQVFQVRHPPCGAVVRFVTGCLAPLNQRPPPPMPTQDQGFWTRARVHLLLTSSLLLFLGAYRVY